MGSETAATGQASAGVIRTSLSGIDLLTNPRLNKGTAFTEAERDAFGLHGLLPPHVGTLEDQRERRTVTLGNRDSAFGKYRLMRDLQDSNETLFYSLIETPHRGAAAHCLHADGWRRMPAVLRDMA